MRLRRNVPSIPPTPSFEVPAWRVYAAFLRDAVDRMDTKNPLHLRGVSEELTATVDKLHALIGRVALLPIDPRVTVYRGLLPYAKTIRNAARKAELAFVSSAEQHDQDAREASLEAFSCASAARAIADAIVTQLEAVELQVSSESRIDVSTVQVA